MARTAHALPLALERSPREQAIEAEVVAGELAKNLGVDAVVDDSSVHASIRVTELVEALVVASADERPGAWDALAEFLYRWDARIQDLLAAGPFGRSSAYQLGRGLAEIYWALEVDAPPEAASSWQFLLGGGRCVYLRGLLTRLAGTIPPITVHAVTHALDAWAALAADPVARTRPEAAVERWRPRCVCGGICS